MRQRRFPLCRVAPWLLAALVAGVPSWVFAQNNTTPVAGVTININGLLERKSVDLGGQLYRVQSQASKSDVSSAVATPSRLRKVSLNRLEAAIAARQNVPTEEMRYLAGLLRCRYVFLYPESNDIVIAGPAEGWRTDAVGRVVGANTGRPVLQLQDLVVALRTFPPGKSGQPVISCSIDPTPEGLASMQQFLRGIGTSAVPSQTQFIVNGLRNSLGHQKISVKGVSPKTNFARVLVEADYRMKLIGIGLENPPVKLVSFIEKANAGQIARNALFRWYFVPDYECVRVSEDGLAMELVGDGVKLIGEDEMVASGGQRKTAAGIGNPASRAFVASFTKHYSELAARSPVYAELRNVIDLSVAAAFLQEQDYYGKANWKMSLLGDEKALAIEVYNEPKMVESAVAAVWKGTHLTTPIGGGVHIEPAMALQQDNRLSDEDGKVAKVRSQLKVDLPADRWWWD